jgi:endoglucanase
MGRLLPLFFLSLVILLGVNAQPGNHSGKLVTDIHGAIIRGDLSQKQIALVFTGDEFADGAETILSILSKHRVKSSFFLTGNFYSNPAFQSIIQNLKKEGHYLGPHSDKHLLYADWTKRDSLLVTKDEFTRDLLANYKRMKKFGIKKTDAKFFIPPYEWYNKTISQWTKELDLQLVNFSPGTRSTADYTYPEMGDRYRPSDEIYQSIISCESKDAHGLNGFILLIHIGTDPRRTDKLYNKLNDLLNELESKGYRFVRIDQLLN